MTRRQIRCYEMFVRVRNFGEQHEGHFPRGDDGATAFATVADAAAALSGHAYPQGPSPGSAGVAYARAQVNRELVTIARTARAIAADSPGFDDPFRLPPRGTRNAAVLISTGRAFIRHAAPVADRFMSFRLPPAFIAELTVGVDALVDAKRTHDAARTGQAVDKARVDAALVSGTAAVSRLDTIVANCFKKDPLVLAAWSHDRRLGYRHRPKRGGAPPAPVVSVIALPVPEERRRLPAPREEAVLEVVQREPVAAGRLEKG